MGGETLRVEQGGQIAVIDPGLGGGGDSRLGVKCDAESGLLQHGEVVGAVSDRQCLVGREAVGFGKLLQRGELGRLAQNGLDDPADEFSILDQQRIGSIFMKAQSFANARGKEREAAGNQCGIGAIGAHGLDEGPTARSQGDAMRDRLVHHAGVEAGEKLHALAKGGLEGDFAAHRAFGDFGDLLLQPDEIGQFIDAFLLDHGRIHVGEQKPLAASLDRLDENIDRCVAKTEAEHRDRRSAIGGVGESGVGAIAMSRAGCERNVGGFKRRQNDSPARAGQARGGGREKIRRQCLGAGGADQSGDMGHKDLNARNISNRKDVQAVLLAGPTASGKSARAIELARELGGVVINADSMAVYQDLPILSARPSSEEMGDIPHLVFGHIGAERNYSVGLWLADAAAALGEAARMGRLPIFVGGTGMYFKALLHGLSNIPAVPAEVRARVRAQAEGVPPDELHARLRARDPETASKLRPSDPQRILRALEIFEAFGAPLATFQGAREGALLDAALCHCVFLAPERETLYDRINARFDRMMEQGALEEVRRLMARGLDPALPAVRAVGVPGLIAHLRGELSLEAAVEKGKRDSRQYAKRQFTFARTQLPAFEWVTLT